MIDGTLNEFALRMALELVLNQVEAAGDALTNAPSEVTVARVGRGLITSAATVRETLALIAEPVATKDNVVAFEQPAGWLR